ncbi:hypothetical protein, partial [Bradyrhizobium diazoefficiens]
RLDQEKGPSTPFQRPPYHSALIPGTSPSCLHFLQRDILVAVQFVGQSHGDRRAQDREDRERE